MSFPVSATEVPLMVAGSIGIPVGLIKLTNAAGSAVSYVFGLIRRAG